MKKGEIYDGVIDHIDYPNRGIICLDEGIVQVKNGIPGQKVRVQIQKKRSNKAEARLLEVLEASPLETRKPVCSAFPACGGCTYQTMDYESQLRMKEEQIRSLLTDAVRQDQSAFPDDQRTFIWDGILGSPEEFGYRNKMEFSFGNEVKDGPLTLGLHRKGSTYDVLETGDCALVHRDLDTVLACVLSFCRETGLPHFHKGNHQGYFRHLLVRCSAAMGEILIHLVTSSQADLDLTPLVQKLLALKLEGRIVGILHLINDSLADVVQSDRTELLWGRDWFYERLMGLTFKITSFSFFQPNSLAAELLYRRVLEYANQYIIRDNKKAPLVYDLYSGTGTITQLLASSVAREAVGVELVEEAVEAARENTLLNNLSNCHFIAGDVLKILDDLVEKPDIIVLDPPRDGIHPLLFCRVQKDVGVFNSH